MTDRDFGDESDYDYGDYEYVEDDDDFYIDPEYPDWDTFDDEDDDGSDDDYGAFVPNRPQSGGPTNAAEAELIYS